MRGPHDSAMVSSKDSIVGKGFRHSLYCIEALTWFADRHMEVMMMEIEPAHAFVFGLIGNAVLTWFTHAAIKITSGAELCQCSHDIRAGFAIDTDDPEVWTCMEFSEVKSGSPNIESIGSIGAVVLVLPIHNMITDGTQAGYRSSQFDNSQYRYRIHWCVC